MSRNKNRAYERYITIDGETKLISDWAKEYNLTINCIADRIRRGWSEEDAVTRPNRIYQKVKKTDLQLDYIPPGVEPKGLACRRLKLEGRYEDFRRRKAEILKWYHRERQKRKAPCTKTTIFYQALKDFPPLEYPDVKE